MWHEARRQERKIRGMLVDYRKRAERRRDFYEKIKADPTQFLQVHGRQCKIHLDPVIAAAADSAVMMPWQGNENNLIDRFDVRAHLDLIPPVKKDDDTEVSQEERHLNYERYRIIAQNAYLGISEEKFLKQLHLEEQFGYTETKVKKEPKGTGAAIGFNYEEGTAITAPPPIESPEENFDEDISDSDLDVDLAINVSKIDSAQAHDMNKHGQQFGMSGNDFYSFLTNDLEEAESYKLAKEEEHEKALYSGRKSRRERRAHREKRLANRKISPPSYAAKESPTNPSLRDESKSPSRSPSPDHGKITYITSFGDDEETPSSSKPTYADKVKYGKPKRGTSSSDRLVNFHTSRRSGSREVSYDGRRRSNSRFRRSRSRSRSRRSRSKNRKSRSRSRSKRTRPAAYPKERSRSYSPRSKRRKSKSRSKSSSPVARKNRSMSRSLRTGRRSTSRSASLSMKVNKEDRRSRSRRSRSRFSTRSRSGSRVTRSMSKQRSSYRRRSVSSSSISSSSSSSAKSKLKSPSKSPAPARSKSKSKSPVAPAPPIIRYYGRKKSDVSSSESSSSEENEDYEMKSEYPGTSDSNNRSGNNSGTTSKRPSSTLTVIERLKLKRQALINRQFKKDKIAEVQKILREKQAQQTREDELREMAIKLRRRQRELRHAYDRSSSSDSEKSETTKKKEASISPVRSRDRDSSRGDRDKDREKDRRDRDRRRSTSRDRSRRADNRRIRSRDRQRRSRSRSRKRYDRGDSRRDRSSDSKESSTRKLVDY